MSEHPGYLFRNGEPGDKALVTGQRAAGQPLSQTELEKQAGCNGRTQESGCSQVPEMAPGRLPLGTLFKAGGSKGGPVAETLECIAETCPLGPGEPQEGPCRCLHLEWIPQDPTCGWWPQ